MKNIIKVVVPISGGKDSQACLKLALEHYDKSEIIGLFCDTGWEHPITYQHINNISVIYDVTIMWIKESTVPEQVLKLKRFPTNLLRFCTDRLKIKPSAKFYKELLHNQKNGFEVWCGMRSDESINRKIKYQNIIDTETYEPHEINKSYPKLLGKGGVKFRLPILNWTAHDVFLFLDGKENPLYTMGETRVGCFPCLASTGNRVKNAYEFDEFGANQKRIVIELEQKIGKKHEPSNTSQMCMFCHI